MWQGIRTSTFALLTIVTLSACVSTTQQTEPEQPRRFDKILDLNVSELSKEQVYWMKQINDYYLADVDRVIAPYAKLAEQLHQWPKEQFCNTQHMQLIEHALTLNNSSIEAYTFQAHCAQLQQNTELLLQIQQRMETISELLLRSGDGQTPLTAIKTRNVYEAQLVFQWLGLNILDVELVRLIDRAVYKLHTLDGETGEYRVVYAQNIDYFTDKITSKDSNYVEKFRLANTSLNTKLVKTAGAPGFLWQFATRLRNDLPDLVVEQLSEPEELGALATVILAQGYFHQGNQLGFEQQIDSLLTLSELGFVEASAIHGQYLISSADPLELQDAANLFKVNAQNLGQSEATQIWLETFLRQANPDQTFLPFMSQLDQQFYPIWREKIYRYNQIYGLVTPIINGKLTQLLVALGKHYPRAQLDYAYLLLEGRWNNQQDNISGINLIQQLAQSGYDAAQLDYGLFYSAGRYGIKADPEAAFKWYQLAADQSNSSAMYNVGLAYRYARGVKKDLSLSAEYMQQAWEQGFNLAGCRIGDLYSEEASILDLGLAAKAYEQVISHTSSSPKEISNCTYGLGYLTYHLLHQPVQGIELMTKAGDLGEAEAWFELGLIHNEGDGIDKNIPAAIDYYQRAIELGNARAAANLGYLYEIGNGVTKSNKRALAYYRIAADGGSATGRNNYATFLRYGTEVNQDIEAAKALYLQAYQGGNYYAAKNLGDLYYSGELGEADFKQACDYYEQAMKLGSTAAIFDVSFCYLYGEGREQDIPRGLELLDQSAEHNSINALLELGRIYFMGEVVPMSYQKSSHYYLQAFQLQSAKAAYGLGQIYALGSDEFDDPQRAKTYYEQSAHWGSTEGMLATARAYLNGFGTKKDIKLAKLWLQKALDNGAEEAQKLLLELK
ncbi:tetratricopeptide repeat protein [Aliiglaciecola sp. LCG003]|uniref:SEL1-like repeat protein n=1 Tax=Aliiglaciecola sp. LCG003 TaxID=3053655 RepID=UPI0025729CC9|nr:tetratricopeptide repeat protein [Aliiglaciecola sp. LCG003]WJG10191.1 tetratricopeptide repeat protein [Aliiglaciecola sp. LCG003]